jgi:hypothetical protein
MGYVVNKLTYQIQDTFDGLCCQPTGNVLNNTTGNVPLALLATLPYVVLQVQNHLRKNYAFVSVPGGTWCVRMRLRAGKSKGRTFCPRSKSEEKLS